MLKLRSCKTHNRRTSSHSRSFYRRSKAGACFRLRATAIVTFLGLVLLASAEAQAQVDVALSGQTRSYPQSGVAGVTLGYSQLLWGDTSDPFYGYLRPRLELNSAGSYNSANFGVELYPISFLGVRAGGESIQNDQEYSAYDCTTASCLGRFYRTYFQSDLSLALGPLFAQARYGRERWTMAEPRVIDFIEPTSGLALVPTGDSLTLLRGLIGYRFNPEWSVLAVYQTLQADQVDGVSRFAFAAVRFSSSKWSVGLGGGMFSSPLKKREATAIAYFEWAILPSLALR